jgi:cytoskeletal protein CcmA (bactofilin family)
VTTTSRLGRGVVVRGTIRGEGDIAIDGRVEGLIEVSGEIAVERDGRVQAPLTGDRVIVRGAVAGEIRASESVVLDGGARVVGDLHAPSIGIRPGGLLRGYVSTSGKAAGGAAGRAAKAERRPAPTQAPRAQRPAAIAQAQAQAVATAPRAREEAAPTAPARSVPARVAAPPPRAPIARTEAAPAARAALVEPAASPMTRASGRASHGGPPPPVVPSLKKGAKGAMKKKGGK